MQKWALPFIVFSGIILVLAIIVVNDKLTPEAERVSPKNNPFIKDDSINNPDSDIDSDTSISEGDSLLGNGYRYSDSDDLYGIHSRGGSRRHRKNNKGSKGRKASKSSKGRKSRKHNNKKSKSKNSKSF